ncbi:tRNA (cytidine(32)/guanosine(34)-2'-O)-methyltransferase [Malassezia sp. CBS 17886]|nr:tRNA (cytidine(32)/guanosine(34)-2'-O)-methyltransferase [Malassezia sp. CBS 17886]
MSDEDAPPAGKDPAHAASPMPASARTGIVRDEETRASCHSAGLAGGGLGVIPGPPSAHTGALDSPLPIFDVSSVAPAEDTSAPSTPRTADVPLAPLTALPTAARADVRTDAAERLSVFAPASPQRTPQTILMPGSEETASLYTSLRSPPSGGASLHPSSSVRSQRNWSAFDGQPVLPLPSPLIRSVLGEQDWVAQRPWDEPQNASPSKTDAFFNAVPAENHLTPPATVARSASSRVPTAAIDVVHRRQRASSTPLAPIRDMLPGAEHTLNPLAETPGLSSAFQRQAHLEPPGQSYETSLLLQDDAGGARSTRHVHGPSVHVTDDSIFPSDSASPAAGHAAQAPAPVDPSPPASSRSDDVGNQLLKAVDVPTEDEDEREGYVGPYRILSKLGTGAFSKVLLGELRRDNAQGTTGRVALKMIACEPWRIDQRMRVSWVREVEVLKHILHPCIVRFVASFRTPLYYTLVLGAVNGGELFDVLARQQANIAQREWFVRRIVGELAGAIGWMHSHNVVHRDIKLENIMMTKTLSLSTLRPSDLGAVPLIKITDFGLARFINPDQLLETRCGSEEYAAPELIIGKQYDGRKTDAWALGVVLYALLCGALPFLETPSSPSRDAAPSSRSSLRDDRERERKHNGPGAHAEREQKVRKAHLLRIAKGELQWPAGINELSDDGDTSQYDPHLRLVTPHARYVASRFLRRDPNKRARCWDLWKEHWFTHGSFVDQRVIEDNAPRPCDDSTMECVAAEASAAGERVPLPYDPHGAQGKRWMTEHCSAGTDVSQVAGREAV